jgi:hypothetical protein
MSRRAKRQRTAGPSGPNLFAVLNQDCMNIIFDNLNAWDLFNIEATCRAAQHKVIHYVAAWDLFARFPNLYEDLGTSLTNAEHLDRWYKFKEGSKYIM